MHSKKLIVASIVFGLVGMGPLAFAENPNPGVLPPHSHSHGLTYAEWGAAWWQWVLSIPFAQNPIFDSTGEDCDVGQSGPVWFLAGTSGSTAVRSCTIPAGKSIFFPIV